MTVRLIDVWVNCPDRETAARIASACVEKRLAACANILAPIVSVYRWKGAIEQAEEIPLLLKTRAALFDAVASEVHALHPYQVPSIAATELVAIDEAYAAWLLQETQGR